MLFQILVRLKVEKTALWNAGLPCLQLAASVPVSDEFVAGTRMFIAHFLSNFAIVFRKITRPIFLTIYLFNKEGHLFEILWQYPYLVLLYVVSTYAFRYPSSA